jgi:hypothetical protein
MNAETITRWRQIADMTKLPQTVFFHSAADLPMAYHTSMAAAVVDRNAVGRQQRSDNGVPVATVLPTRWFD